MNNNGKISKAPWLFNGISWGVTALIVVALLGVTLWKVFPTEAVASAVPTPTEAGEPGLPAVSAAETGAIVRNVTLKTDISSKTTYNVTEYTVQRGDSVFSIAKNDNIKPETLLWANYAILEDSPDNLQVGQVLTVPPTDGVYYQWQEGDTLASVADKFSATVDDILNYPGNKIDLTNPVIKTGDYVMVKGGHREFVTWIIPTIARGKSGTANVGGAACSGGPVGSGAFVWPGPNHYISGNDYSASHLGIDVAGGEGTAIFAADSGVVTLAIGDGGWNHGYGNTVMIDHGNGYVTLYAHLSAVMVATCQGVYAGQTIGLAGSTGNAFGAHLHFEVRLNGGFVNPWYVLPK
jgi:murein DD-endopeptidase MepM/ murein hydrolase activator NlpD